MNTAQRRQLLSDRVAEVGEVGFAHAAELYGVSEMTIRRDMEALEALGVVRRVVGGAIALKGKDSEPTFETRIANAAEEKRHIADAVADFSREKHDSAIAYVADVCGVPLLAHQIMDVL